MIQEHCVTRDQKAHTKKHCRYQKIYQEKWRLNLRSLEITEGHKRSVVVKKLDVTSLALGKTGSSSWIASNSIKVASITVI